MVLVLLIRMMDGVTQTLSEALMKELSPTKTVTLALLADDLAVSQKTVRRMVQAGRIPRPMRINGSALRWLQSEILLWQQLGMPTRAEFDRIKTAEVSP